MITLSFSGLKNLECPFRFYAIQVARAHKEPPTPEMELGSAVHKAIEALLNGAILPVSSDACEAMIEAWRQSEFNINRPGALVERKMAIDANGTPCDFFSSDAMFRGVIDYYYLEDTCPAVVDWKTGRWEVDPKQMAHYAVLALAHEPGAAEVETIIFNVQSNTITRRTYSVEETAEILEEISEHSRDVNSRTEWPAKPCWLCDRCTVPGCPERDRVSTALVHESKLPILKLPDAISTQGDAETALRFVLFAEGVVDRIKGLIKGYVGEHGPLYSSGKVAQFSDKESVLPKDLSLFVKSLTSWGVSKDLIWDNLSLTKTGLEKIIKKADLQSREPLIRAMCEVKTSSVFGIKNDKLF
jgi:hypothetical protein